ncbi:MAG: TRM11 family SAM-dependent methyltransferase [Candidatus Poribacteria bacterium]
MYLYITSRSKQEAELIKAECFAIAGVYPDVNGIAIRSCDSQSENCYDVSRSAYTKLCMKVISQSDNLTSLYASLDEAKIKSDHFRVSVTKISNSLKINHQEVMHQIGLRIEGRPNLNNPKTEFLVVITSKNIWLGEVLSKSDNSWMAHSKKIQQYSSALPTRLARAVVNLVAKPKDRIIDPCCGSGTLLIEAESIGIKAFGCDINPLMIWASMKNIKDFGFDVHLAVADARVIKGTFDAVITDLPYGRNCLYDENLYYEILNNIRNLAPKSAIITGTDISKLLLDIGFSLKAVLTVPKGALTRYISVSY